MSEPSDFLAGTVKGPGKEPHDFLFITRDNDRTRIGEFVYYSAEIAGEQRKIVGTVKERKLARNLPDSFLSDPLTPPSAIASMIGLQGDTVIHELTAAAYAHPNPNPASAIGYFSHKLGDFVNPRTPPQPGDGVFLASSETLGEMLSPRRIGETGSAHIGSLLTRDPGEVPIVLSVRDVVSTHLAILASTGSGKSYTAGVFIEELMQPHNRAAVLIVDPHGEYHTLSTIQGDSQFAGGDGYQPEIKIFTPDKIKVRFSTLTEADIK